jgi:hypothetical protein
MLATHPDSTPGGWRALRPLSGHHLCGMSLTDDCMCFRVMRHELVEFGPVYLSDRMLGSEDAPATAKRGHEKKVRSFQVR